MVHYNTSINHDILKTSSADVVGFGTNATTNNGRGIYVTLLAAASIQVQQRRGIYERSSHERDSETNGNIHRFCMCSRWRFVTRVTKRIKTVARELLVDRQCYLGYREILNGGGSCYPSPPYRVLHTRPPPLARVHLFDLICPSVPTSD